MKKIIWLAFLLSKVILVHSQEDIGQEHKIYTKTKSNPLMVIQSKEMVDTLYVLAGELALKKQNILKVVVPIDVRCYMVSKNITDENDQRIKEVMKNKHDLMITKKRLDGYYTEIGSLEKQEQEKYRKVLKKEKKNKLDSLITRVRILDSLLSDVKCPDSFRKIKGKIIKNGKFLQFNPFKFKKYDSLPDMTKRFIDYFNRDLEGYKNDNFGLNLPESENELFISSNSWQAGALTVPLKIYLGSNQDSIPLSNNIRTDIKFAIFVGRQWGKWGYDSKGEIKTKFSHSFNITAGASKLTLNNKNTKNIISNDTDILTIDLGLAYAFKYNKFNIFFGSGIDLPTSKLGSDWIFKEQLWLGIGVGYSILSF